MVPDNVDIVIRIREEVEKTPSDIGPKQEFWYVEAFLPNSLDHRIAFATVKKERDRLYGAIDFVETEPEYRRRGVGKRLVIAALHEWPYLDLSEAHSPDGEAFLGAIVDSDGNVKPFE